MTTTFLVPSFSKSEKDKVNSTIDVLSEHVLVKSATGGSVPAIASEGFPANRDGTYVFVAFIEKIVWEGFIRFGFTSTNAIDSRSQAAYPGYGGLDGVCLMLNNGGVHGGNGSSSEKWDKEYLPEAITSNAQEIIAILTISNNGSKRTVQFIVDGNEGRVHELAKTDFENKNGGSTIFCVLTMFYKDQKLEFIPFNRVQSRSPKIDELMKEFNKAKNIPSSSPSTSTFENDAVMSQLRDQVARSQDAVIQEKDKQMKNMREMYQKQLDSKDKQLEVKDKQLEVKDKQLEVKEQQFLAAYQQLDLSHSQLELERADHQKTRNLLHQIKMELKDVEIYYLTREKESGQRRQRDEGNEQFKVKQEPGNDEEEKQPK